MTAIIEEPMGNSKFNQYKIWDRQLIDRYDLSGPRYTSYPTAPQFSDDFCDVDLKAAVVRGNETKRSLSLYFHIPFCSTVCYYCACNKIITANHKQAKSYLDLLVKEVEVHTALLNPDRSVVKLDEFR